MYNFELKISGIKIGHYSDDENATGTTVVMCEKGAIIGASVRGSAPGTRETDIANPMNTVQKAHAVFLTGGSAFGLDCAGGIMKYLEQNEVGYKTDEGYVPIVLGSVLYDLGYKSSSVRPDANFGIYACKNATEDNNAQGSIGAGCGATCSKILGMELCEKSGLGISTIDLGDKIYITAIFAANPVGDIYDYNTGKVIAGKTNPTTCEILLGENDRKPKEMQNTTIGVVFTNATLNKATANKMADIAHDGIALSVRPCHTMLDGDSIFALSTCEKECDINRVLNAATIATARAIANSVYSIKGKC